MDVSLSAEQPKIIEAKPEPGRCESAADVVRDGLRVWMEQEAAEARSREAWRGVVREKSEEGWQRSERDESLDGEEVLRRSTKALEVRGDETRTKELLSQALGPRAARRTQVLSCPLVMRPASSAPRYSVQADGSQLWISIPPRRRLWSAALLALFVLSWAVMLAILLFAFATQETQHPLLVAFVCLLLVVGIVCGAYVVAWELAGHERITVTPEALLHSCRIGSLIRSRRYELSRVERIRVQLDHGVWWEEQRARRLHWPTGMIEFQYDGEAQRLGRYLTVNEAQAILTMIEVRAARR